MIEILRLKQIYHQLNADKISATFELQFTTIIIVLDDYSQNMSKETFCVLTLQSGNLKCKNIADKRY